MAEAVMLWLFAASGAWIVWSATSVLDAMKPEPSMPADRTGWVMTGVVGMWAALQPFASAPVNVDIAHVMMAASLAVQSWRMRRVYRDYPHLRR